jgi:hypothetical protein
MMGLVRRLMGGGAFLATASVVALIVVACANGTNVGYVGDDEAGLLLDSGGRDVNVLPTGDSAPSDGATGTDSSGTCAGKVVINELRTDGATASDEFVELFNAGSCAVPLANWEIKYESAAGVGGSPAGYKFVAGDSIPANGYFLVASSTFAGKKDATLVTGFQATSGQVGLVDDKGATVDGVAYGTVTAGSYREKQAAPTPPTTKSIGRVPNGVDTDSNSADFKALSASSPGAAN